MLDQLRENLKDVDYRRAWEANIAMAFIDTMQNHPENSIQENANIAAKYFIDLLIGKDGC